MIRACLVALALLLLASPASAQVDTETPPQVVMVEAIPTPPGAQTMDGWMRSASPPSAALNPRFDREPDVSLIVLASVIAGVGWLGSIAWGTAVLAGSLSPTPRSCLDTYGSLHLVPILGVPIALGISASCPDDPGTLPTGGFTSALVLLPVFAGAAQIAGTIVALVGGLVGERVLVTDGLAMSIAPWATASDGGIAIRIEM